MPRPAILDIDVLLAALPGTPSGVNLREDSSPTSVYFRLKDARNASRAAERMIEAGESPEVAPRWREVLDLSQRALRERTKDLEIVAWMIEALVREHGFAGLRDGFAVAHGLVERFWDELYPRPDEDGVITRVAPFAGLNGDDSDGTLVRPIAVVPIVPGGDHGPYSSWSWRKALAISTIEDERKREAQIGASGISRPAIEAAARAHSVDEFVGSIADVEGALAEWARLGARLEELCGSAAPPTSKIRAALEAVRDDLRQIAGDRLPRAPTELDGGALATSSNGALDSGGHAATRAKGAIDTREEAFRVLVQVADFFRRTEPHSPVAYLLEQSVRWGRMPLHELLPELIPDDGARENLCRLIGIRSARE